MKLIRSLLLAGLFLTGAVQVSAQSDNPCGAPSLTVGATCSFSAANLPSGTTATTGVPAPGCASYSGSDVWYQVTVPPSGNMTVDLNTSGSGPTDMGMAWYSASSCNGPFTLLACDDDSSPNGLMPMITQNNLTPGSTIWVRIWEYGGNAFGPFQVCAKENTSAPCLGGSNNSCSSADPFCTGLGANYCNSSNVPSMGQYACLFSTPNPMWLYLNVSTAGNIDILIQQYNNNGTPIDVDFALYGPFTDINTACANIGPNSPTVDCSYSASATETANITNAQPGQFYMMLVTNFNGQQGNIQFSQSGGGGGTDCNIVQPCTVSATQVADTCSQGVGTVTATPGTGTAPFTYSWSIPGNPTTATVTNVAAGTYTVTMNTDDGCTATANVTVNNYTPTYSSTSTPASCPNGSDGTATANASLANVNTTYQWNDPAAQTTQTATGLAPGSYTCTVTLPNGCSGTTTVTVGANPVNYSATSTLISCPGGSDGTATAAMTPVVGNLSYQWDDAAAQTTQTATNLSQGTYNVTITSDMGCTGTASVTVNEIPQMTAVIASQTDVTCNSGSDGTATINVTDGTSPYSYSWDNSASTTNTATDLAAGTSTITITDYNGCVITQPVTIDEPTPLQIDFITQDTMICPEDDIDLSVNGSGGSSAYTFTWTENGNVIGTGATINVHPTSASTTYCVEMSEDCGSPTTSRCVTITHPTPIEPMLSLPTYRECNPYTFEFFNTSSNASEIGTVFYDFGNYETALVYGDDSTSMLYDEVGKYTIGMTVTSIYGCVYDTIFPDLLETLPVPVADFTISSNPTTIFETELKMQDKSSFDVIQWQWSSPYSTPQMSNYESPTFEFPEGEVGEYPVTLYVTTADGCIDSLTKTVIVSSDVLFYAPNAFTPDGDEFNQDWRFYVDGIDEYHFELLVFNRWGEVVWETHDVNVGWDGTYNGKVVPAGAYSWKAEVKDLYNDKKYTFNGTITILR